MPKRVRCLCLRSSLSSRPAGLPIKHRRGTREATAPRPRARLPCWSKQLLTALASPSRGCPCQLRSCHCSSSASVPGWSSIHPPPLTNFFTPPATHRPPSCRSPPAPFPTALPTAPSACLLSIHSLAWRRRAVPCVLSVVTVTWTAGAAPCFRSGTRV